MEPEPGLGKERELEPSGTVPELNRDTSPLTHFWTTGGGGGGGPDLRSSTTLGTGWVAQERSGDGWSRSRQEPRRHDQVEEPHEQYQQQRVTEE